MKVLLLALLLCLLLPGQVFAQEDSRLHVTPRYDPDGDGVAQGVGGDVPVYVRESGAMFSFRGFTRADNSTASFSLKPGTYIVTAYPPQTRFFFHWLCQRTVFVDEPTEAVILPCKEYFFLMLPWAKS